MTRIFSFLGTLRERPEPYPTHECIGLFLIDTRSFRGFVGHTKYLRRACPSPFNRIL